MVGLCSSDLKDHVSKVSTEGIKNCLQRPGSSLNSWKHWRNQVKGQKILLKVYLAGGFHCKQCSRPLKISSLIKSTLVYWKDKKTLESLGSVWNNVTSEIKTSDVLYERPKLHSLTRTAYSSYLWGRKCKSKHSLNGQTFLSYTKTLFTTINN